MSYATALKYWKSIEVIQARESLIKMSISDYPKMTKESRRKFYRDMRKSAFPVHMQKTMDFEEFAARMGVSNGK